MLGRVHTSFCFPTPSLIPVNFLSDSGAWLSFQLCLSLPNRRTQSPALEAASEWRALAMAHTFQLSEVGLSFRTSRKGRNGGTCSWARPLTPPLNFNERLRPKNWTTLNEQRPYLGRSRKEIRDQILAKRVQIRKHEIPDGWSLEAADFINRVHFSFARTCGLQTQLLFFLGSSNVAYFSQNNLPLSS